MADFAGLSQAYSALTAHRRRTEVIAQNIANIDTPGYSRQRADLASVGSTGAAGLISGSRPPRGVDVATISRLVDRVLEDGARTASSRSASLKEQARASSVIEQRLGGLGDGSLSRQLETLWNGFADIANDPGSLAARQVVLRQAEQVATTVNDLAATTAIQRQGEVSAIAFRVQEMNDLAVNLANVGKSIMAVSAVGTAPNELLDEQATMLNRLSELADITVSRRDDGSVNVYLDGHDLLSESVVKPLRVAMSTDPALAVHGFDRVSITSVATGREIRVQQGELAGLLTVANQTLPAHLDQLDAIAGSIVATTNATHVSGQGLDEVTGRRLFGPEPATARSIRISEDLAGDPRALAAAKPGDGKLDASVAQQLAALGDSPGNPALLVDQLVSSVGSTVASLRSRATVAESTTSRARAARDSVSNVNLDEELTNLIESQRAYESAARLLTTVDEMLDTLINRTGLVGR